jgi:phospholipase/lecithinase/hemolysin
MLIPVKRWLSFVCLALIIPTSISAAEKPYPGIVVFGTSLSDPGNAFHVRGGVNHPPEYLLDATLVPSAPYARGGLHLSNGTVWIVQLARPLGLAGSVQGAYRSASPKATNYAVDRARARDDGLNVNLSDQVHQFLADYGWVAPSDWLYVIEIGSSDVRDALVAYVAGGEAAASAVLQAALNSIATRLGELYGAGARNFLIGNVPDISLTPAMDIVESQVPGAKLLAQTLVGLFNAQLQGIVAQILPADAGVAWLDLFGKLNEIVDDPEAFGFSNVTDACVTPNVPPFTCRDPDEYVFWDGIHPTRAVHAILAQLAHDALGL